MYIIYIYCIYIYICIMCIYIYIYIKYPSSWNMFEYVKIRGNNQEMGNII